MSIKKVSLDELKEREEELVKSIEQLPDEKIDFSDIPELDLNDPLLWDTLEVCPPAGEEEITIRLSSDVLSWYKKKGKTYRLLIRKIISSYYEIHRE